jgi:hypothetical protein
MNLLFSLHQEIKASKFRGCKVFETLELRNVETCLPDCHSRPAREAREELNT